MVVTIIASVVASKKQSGGEVEEYFDTTEDAEFTCPENEFYTTNGCATCEEAFENCDLCYAFTGTSDGSELYSTPIYYSPSNRQVKEYWACSICDEGLELDFFGQSCKEKQDKQFEVAIDT